MKGELIKKTRVDYERGYIYFVSDDGNVCRISENNHPGKRVKVEILNKSNIKKERGYVYYVDEIGDVRRSLLEKIELEKVKKPSKQGVKKKRILKRL